MRWLVGALLPLALTLSVSAQTPGEAPKAAPPLRAGDPMPDDAARRTEEQETFFRKVGERSHRATRSVCAGCEAAGRPTASRPGRPKPTLYKPDTAGGVEDE